MNFLDRFLLSKKLSIYLAAFLIVSVLFFVIFFVFQFQSYSTLEQQQMLQDGSNAVSRMLSDMNVQQKLVTQLASNTALREFVRKDHTQLDPTYRETSEAVLRELYRAESTLSNSLVVVANSNEALRSYPAFEIPLYEVIHEDWFDPQAKDIANSQNLFWGTGELNGIRCLICYKGLYSSRKPYDLEMVVMVGLRSAHIEASILQDHPDTEMLLLSAEQKVLAGSTTLSEQALQQLPEAGSDFWFPQGGTLHMAGQIPVQNSDMGITGWSLLILRNPQSFIREYVTMFFCWLLVLLAVFGSLLMLNRSVTRHIISRCRTVLNHIGQIASEDFTINSELDGNDEFYLINEELNGLAVRLKRQVVDEYNHTIALHQAEIKAQQLELLYQKEQIAALQNQINPHYIVNTLESIRMKLLLQGDDESAEMLLCLAESLQTYSREPYRLVSISEELVFLRRYLLLQNYRMVHPIDFSVEAEDAILEEQIPKFILQPLIENAIIHGFRPKIKEPKLTLSFLQEGDILSVQLRDNGLGLDEEHLSQLRSRMEADRPDLHGGGRSIGLMNVYWRLKLLYGQDSDLSMESAPGCGTTIHITLNLRKVRENELQCSDH